MGDLRALFDGEAKDDKELLKVRFKSTVSGRR